MKFIALNFSRDSVYIILYELFHNYGTIMKSYLCATEFQSTETMCSRNVNHDRDISLQTTKDQVSVSPYTAVKSGLTRTMDLSAHTEQSSQTLRTNQNSGSVGTFRAVKSDHHVQPGQQIYLQSSQDQLASMLAHTLESSWTIS